VATAHEAPPPPAPEVAVAVATMAVVTNAMTGGDDSETEAAEAEAAEAEAAEMAGGLRPLPASGAVGATLLPPLGCAEGEADDEIVD